MKTGLNNTVNNTHVVKVKCENRTSENGRGFIRSASKIVNEWNGFLEIFCRPQVIENCRQYLLLGTDILQENTVVGCA